MSERCPLSELAEPGVPVDVPEVCLRQCGGLMTSVTHGAGEWDDYLHGEPVLEGEIEFSHDSIAIVSLQNRAQRSYSIVDRVTTEHDWQEIGETTWAFACPHDS